MLNPNVTRLLQSSQTVAHQTFAFRIARWYAELGHEVEVHVFDRQEDLPDCEEMDGFRIIRHRVGNIPYGGTWNTWRGIQRFLKSVSNSLQDVDVLHCHDADTLPLARMNPRVKVIFDMHDLQHTWVRMPAPNSLLRKLASYRMKSSMLGWQVLRMQSSHLRKDFPIGSKREA